MVAIAIATTRSMFAQSFVRAPAPQGTSWHVIASGRCGRLLYKAKQGRSAGRGDCRVGGVVGKQAEALRLSVDA